MHCANCGASAISGASRCYRCDRALVAAPPTFDDAPFAAAGPAPAPTLARPMAADAPPRSPSRPSARAASASRMRLVTPYASFFLAVGLVVDLVTGDPPGVVLIAALYALSGVALLRRWRGARVAAWTLHSAGVLLGVLATLGGGVIAGPLMALGSGVGVFGLVRTGRRFEAAASRPQPRKRSA